MLPRPLPLPLRHPRQAPLLLHLVPFLLDRPRPALPPPRRAAARPRAPRRPARLPLHAGRFIRRVRLRAGGRVRHGTAEHRPRAPQRRRGEASPPAFPPIRRPHSRGNRRTPHNRGEPRAAPQTPLRGESAALPAGKRGNVAPAGIIAVFAERFVDPQPLQRGSNPRGSSRFHGFHGSTVRDSRGSDGSRGSGGCGEPVAADADALRGSPVSPFPSGAGRSRGKPGKRVYSESRGEPGGDADGDAAGGIAVYGSRGDGGSGRESGESGKQWKQWKPGLCSDDQWVWNGVFSARATTGE